MMDFFHAHAKAAGLLHISNCILTVSVFIAYPVLLFWFFLQRDAVLARAVIVPLDAFLIISVFRCLIRRPRPYEVFGTAPAIPKDTKGKSFPSRHVFSVFMIAMTYLCLSPWGAAGVLLLVAGCLLAVIRVVSGVHFISDVIAGAAAGVLAGVIGYLWF